MGPTVGNAALAVTDSHNDRGNYYHELKRRNIIRLILTYLVPIIVLSVYFYFQHKQVVSQSQRWHLKAIAENQAKTLDLFLTERLVNLSNLIDDPRLEIPPTSKTMSAYLDKLKKNSETFVDLGFFDSTGIQAAYAGPFPSLENRNYSSETWYATLKARPDSFVITDIYLGFRQKPHFTIGVSRIIDGQLIVLRATLEPQKMYEFITTLEGSHEVNTSIVNEDGFYQLVTPSIGLPLEPASFVPPRTPRLGTEQTTARGSDVTCAYSWLQAANWALVVQPAAPARGTILSGFEFKFFGISAAIVLLVFLIILNRANRLVEMVRESDRTRSELEHAAKLASVGELAAGIAHEINNPLAAISEEAGLMKDLLSDRFGQSISTEEVIAHLDSISDSVFRCRDVTQKLLKFVRKTDLDLKLHDVHQLIDDVVDGLLGHEMKISNIAISRNYQPNLPPVNVDGNQLEQVLLNILNNGIDAIGDNSGRITVTTRCQDNMVRVSIADTGKGIAPEHIDKIFLPFFTTKEVGKGTGLGLSVSYGIIKSLGGRIEVESTPAQGSTFTILLLIPRGSVTPYPQEVKP
jgi:two-component system NtrC family sensor kinase